MQSLALLRKLIERLTLGVLSLWANVRFCWQSRH